MPVIPNFVERLALFKVLRARPPLNIAVVVLVAALGLFVACRGGSEDVTGPRLALAGDSFDLGEERSARVSQQAMQ